MTSPEFEAWLKEQRQLEKNPPEPEPDRTTKLERTLLDLVSFLSDVYWPTGQSPLLWAERIDHARAVLRER